MAKSILEEDAIKTTWMILNGLGYYEGDNVSLVNDVRSVFDTAPSVDVPGRPRWISVKERKPDERINPNTRDFEFVLCTTIWGDVRPFKYGTPIGQKEAHFWNGAGYVDAYVTHWMPLPEPPREHGNG